MAVQGVFASDQNIAGTPKNSFASAILQKYPTGSAPMFALSSGMRTSDSGSVIETWFEENHLSGYLTVTNSAGTGTTLTMDDISQIVGGALLLNQATGEYMFVDSISGSNATVTRGFAGSTVTSISANDKVQRITTAHEEGSSKPTSIANLGTPKFQYHHIVRNSWDATGTAKAVQYHTGNVVAKNRADAGMFHSEDIERGMIWSAKTIGVLNNKPFRTMDGITRQIVTNVTSQSTNTKWSDIDNFLQGIFEKNIKGQPNERIVFCGNTVLSVLNRIAVLNSQMTITPMTTEFGLKLKVWMTPYGDISLMTHPLMNENPVWTKAMYVIHPGAVEMRYLRRTHHDAYDQDGRRAGVDADYGVYTTELCTIYHAEETGGIYTGIDTAAAGF